MRFLLKLNISVNFYVSSRNPHPSVARTVLIVAHDAGTLASFKKKMF